MAVGSNSLGLLFKINVDAKDAQKALEQLPQGLKTIEKSVADVGASFRSTTGSVGQFITTFGPVAGAITAAAGALQICIKAAIDLGSELHDLSQATGITVENLSALRVAAATSGTSLEQLTNVFVRFQHAALEGGPTAQAALARFGLTAKDVADDSTVAFDKFLKSFNEMGPTAQRNADSMALFGRGAKELIPTFAELSGGLEDARKKAEALGLLFHDDLAKNADEAGDAIDILKLQINAIAVGLGQNLLPVIRDLVSAVSQLAPYIEKAAQAIGFLLEKTQNLNDLKQVIGLIEHLRNVLGDIRELTGKAPEPLAPKTFSNLLQQKADADKLKADQLQNAYLKGVATGDWSDWVELNEQKTAKAPRAARAARAAAPVVDEFARALEAAQREHDQFQKQLNDSLIRSMEDLSKELNKSVIDHEKYLASLKQQWLDYAQFVGKEMAQIVEDLARQSQPIPGGGTGIPGLPDEATVQEQLDAIHKHFDSFFGQLGDSILNSTDIFASFTDLAIQGLEGLTSALETTFRTFILTGQLGAQAFRTLTAAILSSLVIEAVHQVFKMHAKSVEEAAAAAASAASGDYVGAVLHSIASEHYAHAAIAWGLVGGGAAVAGVALGATGGLGGGGSKAAAAGGEFGGQTAPGTVTINQGGGATLGIVIAQHTAVLERIENKLSSMSPADVITVGAEQNPTAIGQANNEAARRDGSISREFLQISGLRTA